MLVLMVFAFLDLLFRKVMFYKEKVGRDPLKRKRSDILEGSLMALGSVSYLHMHRPLTLLWRDFGRILYTIFNSEVSYPVLCFEAMAIYELD